MNKKHNNQETVKKEFSAGGVVFKKTPQGKVFLLGKHSGYHKWVLPKGLIEKGENSQQTAIREIEEETAVKSQLVLEQPIHVEKYVYLADYKEQPGPSQSTRRVEKYQEEGGQKTKVFKTVTFYLLEHEKGDPQDHGWEMEEAGWFNYEQALEKLAFKGEKEALKKAKQKIKEFKKEPFLF